MRTQSCMTPSNQVTHSHNKDLWHLAQYTSRGCTVVCINPFRPPKVGYNRFRDNIGSFLFFCISSYRNFSSSIFICQYNRGRKLLIFLSLKRTIGMGLHYCRPEASKSQNHKRLASAVSDVFFRTHHGMPFFSLMAGSGGYVQGFVLKVVGHFPCCLWFRTPSYQRILLCVACSITANTKG